MVYIEGLDGVVKCELCIGKVNGDNERLWECEFEFEWEEEKLMNLN